MPSTLFYCDPAKNTACAKKNCHINGGSCIYTRDVAFTSRPDKVILVLEGDPLIDNKVTPKKIMPIYRGRKHDK